MAMRPFPSLFAAAVPRLLASALLAGLFGSLRADPLTAVAAVQTRPDSAAPVITFLKAGAEPAPEQAPGALPPGWIAVTVPGPFLGYVLNEDFSKALNVRPGSPIYLAPKPDAGVLAPAAAGDKIDIVGLYGRWTQVRLNRDVVGYVQVSPEPAPPPAAGQAGEAPAPVPEAVPAPAGGPAQAVASGAEGAVPRFFEGRFSSSRRLFAHPPYAWQLDDGSGQRIAYLDVGQLLLTEQIDTYAGREVLVYGPARELPGGRDLVIDVQSLELK